MYFSASITRLYVDIQISKDKLDILTVTFYVLCPSFILQW